MEYRNLLSERQAEMQLAVEEQQLQKVAALKQQGTEADEIYRKYTELMEVTVLLFLHSAHRILSYIVYMYNYNFHIKMQ